MGKAITYILVFGLHAFAQTEEPKVVVNLMGFRYPLIARSARIQGDAIFEVSASGRRLVAGSPILSKPAEANLETWILPPLEAGRYLVSYHFELLEHGPASEHKTVPIGNRFGGFFRRLVGAPTKKVVTTCHDRPTDDPPPRYTLVKDGDVKIDVFLGAVPACIQTQSAQLARNSHL